MRRADRQMDNERKPKRRVFSGWWYVTRGGLFWAVALGVGWYMRSTGRHPWPLVSIVAFTVASIAFLKTQEFDNRAK